MSRGINFEPNGQMSMVGKWKVDKIAAIHAKLEVPNWAPWLSASPESLIGRTGVFPDGQLVISDVLGNPLASLSMNRINWDGNPATLPSWDEVAGDPTTYAQTYQPEGNALVMMSMNVNPTYKGAGLARQLIDQAKLLAGKLGTEYVIGSFRPNEYGIHKAAYGAQSLSFEDYCQAQRPDGLPVDGWLRNLTRNGMKPLKVDEHAMIVSISLDDFYGYKSSHHPELWKQVSPAQWECGEVGSWYIDAQGGTATYQESNLWGIAWQKTGSQ